MPKTTKYGPEVKAAIEIASRKDDHRSHRIGCALKRHDGALIVFANQCDPVIRRQSHHAEARCASKATPGSIVYVVRILSDGSLSMARPCKGCQKILKSKGVKYAIYSNWEGKFERLYL